MKDKYIKVRTTKPAKDEFETFASELFERELLEGSRANVSAMVHLAVNEYKTNPATLAPGNRNRLIRFARKCCGGSVNRTIDLLLNSIGAER